MYQLIIYICEEKYLEDIMTVLTAAGINEAFVIDSLNLTHALAYKVPIFAGLRAEIKQGPKYSKIIFATVNDNSTLKEILSVIKDAPHIDKRMYKIIYFPVKELKLFEKKKTNRKK